MADKGDCAAKRDLERPFFSKLAVSDTLWLEKRRL